MVQLYRLCQWGGMSPGLMPDEGAVNDQSSWLMEAFMVVASADAEYRRDRREQ